MARVDFLQRIADENGNLLPFVRAIKLGAGLSYEVHKDEALTGAGEAEGSVTGYITIIVDSSAAVTFAAVKAALGAADSSVSFNTQDVTLRDLSARNTTLSGALYFGSVTSGAGQIRGGASFRINVADSGTPTVADQSAFNWTSPNLTVGASAETHSIRALSTVEIKIGSEANSFDTDGEDTAVRGNVSVTLETTDVVFAATTIDHAGASVLFDPISAPSAHATKGTIYYSAADGKFHAVASVADGSADTAMY